MANKRQKKKQMKKAGCCPVCSSKDGIVGEFNKGNISKRIFLYCDKCEYSFKFKKRC